jgi:molecular chaperone HscB
MTAWELTRNHFELFGLPARFAVDEQVLAERYRELQRTVHPDRFVNATDQERRLSMQRAAQINEAFRTLRDPLARARYLLELRSGEPETDAAVDPGFLMEQMELREALSEVRAHGNQDELTRLLAEIEQRIDTVSASLQAQLNDEAPEALVQARDSVRKLQFLNKLREDALEAEAELEDRRG